MKQFSEPVRALPFQAACLTHVIALARPTAGAGVIAGAEQALKTIQWMEQREGLLRQLIALDRESPALAAIFRVWPEAKIMGVRDGT